MFQIRDLQTIIRKAGSPVLSEHQHLLRRFGGIYFEEIKEGIELTFNANSIADQVWMLVKGEGILSLTDMRKDSPSFEITEKLDLNDAAPLSILIPFGVEIEFSAKRDSQIIRVITHDDELSDEG